MSRELILKMSMSVDGFVAGPNGEIDWMFPSMSDSGRQWIVEFLDSVSLHAIGHRTYQSWVDFWPTSNIPMARPMNEIPKAVFSRSGVVSLPDMEKTKAALSDANVDQAIQESWLNPIVGGTDLVADIQRLKAEDGKPILAQGGVSFASSLIAANLIDVFHLVVHPVAIGRGLSIFDGLEKPLHLKLEDLLQFDSGAMVKTYRPV